MSVLRLGAVGYLNARPLVDGLDRSSGVALRFDVPSRCAVLLHEGAIDAGLIPSIEYLRGAASPGDGAYRIVPDVAIASRGPVASVALYTTRPMADVRSIALDTSSRTSVALVSVLCARAFRIAPTLTPAAPDLGAMLAAADAALIIGDNALFIDHTARCSGAGDGAVLSSAGDDAAPAAPAIEKIDLGEVWTATTGLPFVYAFWAGRPGQVSSGDVARLQAARDMGAMRSAGIAREYCADRPDRQPIAARYLRDNIKYHLGADERAGLELFYRYAHDAGLVPSAGPLRFF